MNPTRATEILRSLADGLDPATGRPFPPDSPYQQADTVRALRAALDALSSVLPVPSVRASPDPASALRPRASVPSRWTPDEEQRLKDAFTVQTPIKAIAAAHGRTPGSITARLLRLGLLDPATTHAPFAPAPIRPQSTAPATSHPPPVPSPSPTLPPPDRPTVPPSPAPPKPDDAFPF